MIWQYFDFYTSFNKLQKSCYIIGWKKSRRSRFCCASSIYWFVGILPVSCASVALGHLAWKVVFLSFSKNICSLQLESWLFKHKSRKDWAPVCCCWDDYHHNTHTTTLLTTLAILLTCVSATWFDEKEERSKSQSSSSLVLPIFKFKSI